MDTRWMIPVLWKLQTIQNHNSNHYILFTRYVMQFYWMWTHNDWWTTAWNAITYHSPVHRLNHRNHSSHHICPTEICILHLHMCAGHPSKLKYENIMQDWKVLCNTSNTFTYAVDSIIFAIFVIWRWFEKSKLWNMISYMKIECQMWYLRN